MKFIHISDLHFGKSIHGISLFKDQKYWICKFVNLVRETKPDAVLVAGDVYDKSMPSSDATELLDLFLSELAGLNIPVLLIAGNHDSGRKLSFAGDLLKKHKIFISGRLKKTLDKVTIEDEWGKVNFYLLPYVYPALADSVLNNDENEEYAYDKGSYEKAVRAILSKQDINRDERNVIIAHQNVVATGVEQVFGGSETTVGGLGQVSYTAFDDFDYVALGHIHASYEVGKNAVRYSGSPLCYHFDETKQKKKGPLLVTLKEKGQPVEVEALYIEALHPLREIKGTFEEVSKNVNEIIRENEFIKIVITDRKIDSDDSMYFKTIFEKRNSIVLEMTSEYREFSSVTDVTEITGKDKNVTEYFADLYRERKDSNGLNKSDIELVDYLGELTINHIDKYADNKVSEEDVDKVLKFLMKQGE